MAEWLASQLDALVWLVIGGALTAIAIVVVYSPIMALWKFAEWLDYRRATHRALKEEQETDHSD